MIRNFKIVLPAALAFLSACRCGEPAARPSVVIVSPENRATIDGLAVTVRFRVEGAPAAGFKWSLNGGPTTGVARAFAAGDEAELDVVLADGLNDVWIAVHDETGEAGSASVYLQVVRGPPPAIAVRGTADDTVVYRGPRRVEGSVTSVRAITSASLVLNGGAPQPLALTGTGEVRDFAVDVTLAAGPNVLAFAATNDQDRSAALTLTVRREVDQAAPRIALEAPRDRHSSRGRRALVQGTVSDNDAVGRVWIEQGGGEVEVDLDRAGRFTAWLDLQPGTNPYTVRAEDVTGNAGALSRSIYYGQRLGAGGASGGAIVNGEIHTWGRNNLGQTGLDYVSHESQTTWCDRSGLATPFEIAACKATSLTAINALCDSSFAGDAALIASCKTDVAAKRAAVCAAAGASAPASCATSATANLWSACTAAYGAGTPAGASCKVDLVCNAPYAGTARDAQRALCGSTVTAVPITYPAPATPYAPVKVADFSTTATPAAATGTGVSQASLGITFVSLSFNQNAASALDSAGDVWSWGDGANGMLCLGDAQGDVDANDRKIPHRVAPFGAPGTRTIALSRGYDHLLILRSDGTVWGCGLNNVGQLGDGTSGSPGNNRTVPTQVQGLPPDVIQVQASAASSYALTRDGLVYAWGRNQYGNLGQGTVSSSTAAQVSPLLVPGLTGVASLASGRDHVLALKADGTVWAWGLNGSNQVGPDELTTPPGDPVSSPVQVAGATGAVAVYGNANQGFYEDREGRLRGWGQNGSGNLGIPEEEDQPSPLIPVFGLSGIIDASIGALHGFVIMPTSEGDKVFGWGWSFHGSLGGGSALIHTWAYRTPLLVQLP